MRFTEVRWVVEPPLRSWRMLPEVTQQKITIKETEHPIAVIFSGRVVQPPRKFNLGD